MTAKLAPGLIKVGWRYLFSHLLQSLLMLLGIALGVAVAVSVDVANASAARAFDLSTEAVVGRSTHYISGGPNGLPDSLYTDLKRAGLDVPMAPILSQLVTSSQLGDAPLQMLGIDPFAEPPFRSYLYNESETSPSQQMGAFFVVPGAILISSDLAAEHNLESGDHIDLGINGRTFPAFIAGLIQPRDSLSRRALENLVLADISTVQEFTGKIGRLERIDLIIPADKEEALLPQIEAKLPEGAVLLPAEGRSQAVEQMTAAFRTNLTALSLLGLVVGVFLIYNTMTFSVVQRRHSFGTLRALGVSSREIFTLVLGEALVVGIVGSAFGLLLGVLFGRGSVDLVSQTINDIFYTLTVRQVSLPAFSLVKGALLGVSATLFAALLPAWEAAKSPPRRTLSRSQLESISQILLARAALVGSIAAILSGIVLATVDLSLTMSFIATFGLVIGIALTAPWITQQLMPVISRILTPLIGPLGRLGPREVSASASRTSPAMVALLVAVAVTIGGSLMVSSFRASVVDWLNVILSADIYGSVAGSSLSEPSVAIDPRIVDLLEHSPNLEAVYLLRNAQVDSPYVPITVAANDNNNDGNEQVYLQAKGSGDDVWQAVRSGSVIISEPLANRFHLGVGDSLKLFTQSGPHDFPIAAVISDYSSSRGNVTMWLDVYRQWWHDNTVTAFSAKVAQGQDVDATVSELQQELNRTQLLNIRSNRALRTGSLEIFDRTFLITSALQLITTAVAFVGVLSAMLSLQLEKQRQMGVLKAIGLSGRQIWALTLLETGLIGAAAGLLALPTGYAIAQVLLRLINRRAFGWTLQMHLEARPFEQALLVATLAALLAGIYPAYRASRRSAAEAMRFD